MSDYAWPEDFWPHQLRGCRGVAAAQEAGQRRIVFTSPTGMGKSFSMVALIERANASWENSVLYTHRRLLLLQTSSVLNKHGVEHGLRAAGHDTHLLRSVQLAMTPTEVSAVFKRQKRELHPATLALADELHAQGGGSLPLILRQHYESGATVVGFTATPLDLVGEWDKMVVAGNVSEGRKCGALIPAYTFCPDEPDLKKIKNYKVGDDLTDKENAKAIMRPGVFGRVLKHWKRLNPEGRPTLLFAPDVAGSIYFAEQFHAAGVRSAHIDAKQIWYDGEYIDSTDANRQSILAMTETGQVQVLCNRFVLREGIDLPHIAHCIFACVFGSLKTYLQAGGRSLRAHPSLESICIQDHGANYIRHGSLNENRDWELGMSGYKLTGMRQEAMREDNSMEPIICPKCGMGRLSGPKCLFCGYECRKRSRIVVQINGDLKQVEGPAFRKRYRREKTDTEAKWSKMYHRAKSKKWNATFRQAEGLFCYEEGYWPPKHLTKMPIDPSDWYEKVADVPPERLR